MVWNRILVYATLFWLCGQGQVGDEGSSHQVRKSQISISMPAYSWHSMFIIPTAQMSHYASVANTASTFLYHPEADSSGGGFSGGGGGGSVGAF